MAALVAPDGIFATPKGGQWKIQKGPENPQKAVMDAIKSQGLESVVKSSLEKQEGMKQTADCAAL